MTKRFEISLYALGLFLLTYFYQPLGMPPKAYAILLCGMILVMAVRLVTSETKAVPFIPTFKEDGSEKVIGFVGLIVVLLVIFLVGVLFFNMPLRLS